jgi:hypothetical protein
MNNLPVGSRVRMTEALKAKLRGQCTPGKHFCPADEDGDCLECSTVHVEEFGDCIGIVQGPTDYNNVPQCHPDYSQDKVGPEIDVLWQPSNLRYAYHPDDLELVE